MPTLLLLLLLRKDNNLTINPNHRLTHTLHHDTTTFKFYRPPVTFKSVTMAYR